MRLRALAAAALVLSRLLGDILGVLGDDNGAGRRGVTTLDHGLAGPTEGPQR